MKYKIIKQLLARLCKELQCFELITHYYSEKETDLFFQTQFINNHHVFNLLQVLKKEDIINDFLNSPKGMELHKKFDILLFEYLKPHIKTFIEHQHLEKIFLYEIQHSKFQYVNTNTTDYLTNYKHHYPRKN